MGVRIEDTIIIGIEGIVRGQRRDLGTGNGTGNEVGEIQNSQDGVRGLRNEGSGTTTMTGSIGESARIGEVITDGREVHERGSNA